MVDSCRIFSDSSNVLKVCAVVLDVAFIVHCVGIGTTFWVQHEDGAFQSRYHSGLFRSCSCLTFFGEKCVCASDSNMAQGWLKCVQALEVIGLIAIICVEFLIFMQFFCAQSIAIKMWGIMLMLFAGVCILAGVSLYGAMMVENLSFSFGLCVVSAVMCFLCSSLLIEDRRISLKRLMSTSQIHYANQGQIISSPNTQFRLSLNWRNILRLLIWRWMRMPSTGLHQHILLPSNKNCLCSINDVYMNSKSMLRVWTKHQKVNK